MNRLAILVWIVVVALIFAGVLLGRAGSAPPGGSPEVKPQAAVVAKAELKVIGRVRLSPDHLAAVSARHAGIVTAVLHQVGERVQKGDIVAEVDSPELARAIFELRQLENDYTRYKVEQSRAESLVDQRNLAVIAASAQADILEDEVLRLREAPEGGGPQLDVKRIEAITLRHQAQRQQSELEQARRDVTAARDQAAGTLRAAGALREVIGPQVAPPGSQGQWASESDRPHVLRLVAPIDGVVSALDVRIGQGVGAGEPILELADTAVMLVEAEVAAENAGPWTQSPAQQVQMRLPGRTEPVGQGLIKGVLPAAGPGWDRIKILISVENTDGALREGQIVELTLAPSAAAVSEDAAAADPTHPAP